MVGGMVTDEFEGTLKVLIRHFNVQLPCPRIPEVTDPLNADVFIVGMNQRNPYPTAEPPHRRHIDALFNRKFESCCRLYQELTKGKSSRTRREIWMDKHRMLKSITASVFGPRGQQNSRLSP